jgi:DNA-binding protein Fis
MAASASAVGDEPVLDTAGVLGDNDLKVVIPTVERLLIDRVLRRSLGNQSKAARELNLSRGALIAKIKEYSIPDYRSLRRNKQ